MSNREKFEAFLVSEYAWANDALNAADFHGDDATGYYTGGDYIYDGQSCSECLFWAWRGWQAASKASEQQLAAVVAENAGLKRKGREVLNEACKVYEKLNATISSDSGDFMDGQTLHEFQFLLDADTPAANSFLDKPEGNYAALAAENAQMLRLLTDISENHDEYVNADEYLYAGVPMDYVSEINAYVSRDVDAENPFKETDAYLAEVRAQGVELYADNLDSSADDAERDGFDDAVKFLRSEASGVRLFAAQLRQGAAL